MKQQINPFQIEGISIFNEEEYRQHIYTDEQFLLVQQMTNAVNYHLSQFVDKPFTHIEIDRADFLHHQAYYYRQCDINHANNQICSVGYYAGAYAAYRYDPRDPYLLEFEDHDFDLFFAFKLRQIDLVTELDDFLNYWHETHKHGFTRFYTLLQRKYTGLIDSITHQSVLEWIELNDKKEQQKVEAMQASIKIETAEIEHSDTQFALLFHYFQEHFGFYPEDNKQKQDFIKFLHALKGKPFSKLQNSHINRLFKKTPSVGTAENSIKHLTQLQNTFLKYGLTQMSNLVQADILKENKAKSEK